MAIDQIQGQMDMFGEESTGNESYEAFVDKFKPKKTTDDCYTPDNVFEAVAGWVCAEFGVRRETMVRPFWPGGDYQAYDYPDGCVVVDNPPFSIITRIQRFYMARGIPFFLFAPTLTLFSGRDVLDVCYIPVGISIKYANGAAVNTSFVTSLDDCIVRSAPTLYRAIKAANDVNKRAETKQLPKYAYPANVLTAAAAYQYSCLGVEYRLDKADCVKVYKLDSQAKARKVIFGGGFLLSDRAAADRAAAKRDDVRVWELSERERAMVRELNKRGGCGSDNP